MTIRIVLAALIVTAFALPAVADGAKAPAAKSASSGRACEKAVSDSRCLPGTLKSYDLWIRDVDGGVVDRFVTNTGKKCAASPAPRAKSNRRPAIGPVD